MVALLNLVVPVIIFIFIILAFRDWKKNYNKSRIVINYTIPLICIVYVYQLIQPSYMPKGSVPKMKRALVEVVEYQVQDRMMAPKHTIKEREDRFNGLMDYKDKIDNILNDKKPEVSIERVTLEVVK